MTAHEIHSIFAPLWNDINQEKTFPAKRPLLAHYTSISTLESIMRNDEVWFSNPLYMNDLEELRFGILEGTKAFRQHEGIRKALADESQYATLCNAFDYHFDQFSNTHAFDTYVFCLSEHEPGNTDGLLSMWRGYGGNGKGAALVFDTAQIEYRQETPLIIANVEYASADQRLNWINTMLDKFASILTSSSRPKDNLPIAAYQVFERIKIFALFTKHHGFSEEREWRIVYLRERDRESKLADMLDYSVGTHGIEPKLKFKVRGINGLTDDDLSLEKIVTQIILGPTLSNQLALSSVRRMLEKANKHTMAPRVSPSTIPFRFG